MDNILDRAEEIIKAFSMCGNSENCNGCPYDNLPTIKRCATLDEDMLALVRALQSELAKVTTERDALKANAEPTQHGRWLPDGYGGYHCSGCGQFERWKPNYCCDCGSKMDLTEADNEAD